MGERALVGDHGDLAGGCLGRPWIDAVHGGDRGPLLAQWLETVARGLEFVCDVRVGGQNGPAGRSRSARCPS